MISAHNFRLVKSAACFGVAALLSLGATAQIAAGTTGIDASGSARSEMNACLTGRTQQDQETCMTEVRNANAAKRAGKVDNADGQFSANALKRCDVFQGEDLVACQARIVGYGKTDGSVAGGGAIRQVETVVMPAGATNVRVQPQTNSNIVVIPAPQ
ncbi:MULTISPECIES: hypothetical protein [unclassified Polaromonas]|uniref:hypothetical protein n=1 Tax=unclassified Polaromonas TaxID=2638319 RepID=UPI000F07B8A5|nr:MULTISPECIES: hypothetical protein [unclassified Polaromonas]AYQ26810.1 hypothetical protein DT070_01430 [Polaromonas sp. SP1]QGJ18346.1 hypothetical protein F7R28_08020 [Polaromonas sp. Pch-P]